MPLAVVFAFLEMLLATALFGRGDTPFAAAAVTLVLWLLQHGASRRRR